jgi:hypothetical protein
MSGFADVVANLNQIESVMNAYWVANMQAPWVEAEWGLFLTQKRAGKKSGNIITVVCGSTAETDVPMPLSGHQSVALTNLSWREMLRGFLPR